MLGQAAPEMDFLRSGGGGQKRAHSASKQVAVMSCDCGQTRENPLLPLN